MNIVLIAYVVLIAVRRSSLNKLRDKQLSEFHGKRQELERLSANESDVK